MTPRQRQAWWTAVVCAALLLPGAALPSKQAVGDHVWKLKPFANP